MSTTRRVILCLAAPLLLAHALAAEPAAIPAPKEPAAAISGTLVLGGGGALPNEARSRFLELAGGKEAHLVVLSAKGNDGAAKALEDWKKAEPASAVLLTIGKPEDAEKKEFTKALDEATGVWLEGQDLKQLASLGKALQAVLQRGGVIGCSSPASASLGAIVPGEKAEPGLGLLPGFVIEPKQDKLSAILIKHPGYAGLAIDEETAVIVKGRRLMVMGTGQAHVCLAPSAKKPAGVQHLKAKGQADLIALSRSAISRSGPAFPPEKPEAPVVPKGALIIVGGGGMPAPLWQRFIDLAGGPDAPILVVPTALEPVPKEPGEMKALRRFGAKNISVLHASSRDEADTDKFIAPLREAKGVWFCGGRQWRFVDAYQGTKTERAFHDVLARGGVIGGSSAGASIQSEYMPRGDPLGNFKIMAEGYEQGFGFLKGAAVDQHFFVRKRQADMTSLVNTYPQLLGIGIDESTGIVVQGAVMEVVGKTKVAIYDRSRPAAKGEKDYLEVPAGKRFNLKTRKMIEDK